MLAVETRTASIVAGAASRKNVAGVLKQIAQGTTKGKIFENREGRLPLKRSGYYREHTVPTPGLSGRQGRRLVTGERGEVYFSHDHYGTFVRIR